MTTTQSTVTEDSFDSTLENAIIDTVSAICAQDSSNKGAWSFVVCRRVSLARGFFEVDIASAIEQMLEDGTLFVSFTEKWDGMLKMEYLKILRSETK